MQYEKQGCSEKINRAGRLVAKATAMDEVSVNPG
jgi:hypothetical protein